MADNNKDPPKDPDGKAGAVDTGRTDDTKKNLDDGHGQTTKSPENTASPPRSASGKDDDTSSQATGKKTPAADARRASSSAGKGATGRSASDSCTPGSRVDSPTESELPSNSQQLAPVGQPLPMLDLEREETAAAKSDSELGPKAIGRTPRTARLAVCDICPQLDEPRETRAEFLCALCDQAFCVRCAKRHIETIVFASHELMPTEKKPEEEMVDLRDLLCRSHPERPLGYFCHGCQQVACCLCISFQHGGKEHHIDHVDKLNQNKQLLLMRYEMTVGAEVKEAVQTSPRSTARSTANPPRPRLLWKRETVRGQPGEAPDGSDQLCGPVDVTFLPDGKLVIVDRWNKCVKQITSDGKQVETILNQVAPLRLCSTPAGRIAVVDDYGGGQIKILTDHPNSDDFPPSRANSQLSLNGHQNGMASQTQDRDPKATGPDNEAVNKVGKLGTDGPDGEGARSDPQGRRGSPSSQNDVNDNKREQTTKGSRDRKASRSSQSIGVGADGFTDQHEEGRKTCAVWESWKPEGLKRPWAVAVTRFDHWVVSEYEQYERAGLAIYRPDGELVRTFGSHGERDEQLEWPGYVAADSRGRLLVSDYWSHAVKVFDARGRFVAKVGKGWGKKPGHLTFPRGVCVDADDNILVVDSGNARVCRFAPNGDYMGDILTADDGIIVEPEGIAFIELAVEAGLQPQGGQTSRQTEGQAKGQAKGQPVERRLAVTMSQGRDYSAVVVYSLPLK